MWSWPPLLSQLPVMVDHTIMEPANFYDTVHGHYSVPWPPVYLKSWPKVYISCYTFCIRSTALVGKPEELCSCSILLHICWNLHSLADLPVVQPTSVLCPQVCLTHWNFLVAYDYCTWSSYWVTGLGTCFPTQPPVSILCIAYSHMWQCTVQFS